jgi:hypothetical protein
VLELNLLSPSAVQVLDKSLMLYLNWSTEQRIVQIHWHL